MVSLAYRSCQRSASFGGECEQDLQQHSKNVYAKSNISLEDSGCQ